MHFLRNILLLGYLLIDLSIAASCDFTQITAVNQSQLDAIKHCKTYPGVILIGRGYTGPANLDGIEILSGALLGEFGTNVTSISSTTLREMESTLSMSYADNLEALNFPALTSAAWVRLTHLPKLSSVGFSLNKTGGVELSSTGLVTVQGLVTQTVDEWALYSNKNLTKADFSKLTSYKSFIAEGNNRDLSIDLSSVRTAGESRFVSVKNVKLNSLKTTTEELVLKDIQSDTSLYSLTQAANIDISFNGSDTAVLWALETVHGNITISGDHLIAQFPKLQGVDGSFNVTSFNSSYANGLNCADLADFQVSGPVYSCQINGTAHNYTVNSSYSNAAPTADVGNPSSMKFRSGGIPSISSMTGLSIIAPLLVVVASVV